MSCLRSLPSEVQGIRFSHLGHAVDPQRVLCSPSQHLHLTQWDNRRDRALGSQNGKTTLSFCLWLQLALTQVKSISPVKPVTTVRQAALLHLVIPALFPIILSFEFPTKKVTSPAMWGCHMVTCYSVPLVLPLLLKCHNEKLQSRLIPSPLTRDRRSKGGFLRMSKIKAVSKKPKFTPQVPSTSKQNHKDCIQSEGKSTKWNLDYF